VLTFDQLSAEMPAFKLSKGFTKHRSEEIPLETKENIVAIKNLHYTYLAGTPLAKHALQGVDLKVAARGIHAIAGANGSGKSTLLQHLNGILKPIKGSIQVCGFDLTKATVSLRDAIRKVGLVFQNPETQFFEVFVGDEIAYGPKQFQMEDIRERVRQAMGLVGLDFNAFKDRRLQTLSGGEKRKVAIASTLVLDQELLLFDEPIAGMDPQARQELLALINSLNQQGKTVIITSHRLEELARMTRRISIMAQGQVKCTGPTSEVLSDVETLKKSQLSPPLLTRVSHALINKGWPISAKDTMTTEKLLLTLKRLT
jgi:energy-coupling factor transport system ATP-binding protein